ncbi:hypothetical protein TruAng_002007 [Truncatella angustata]|nr:hypothetical protein TruAng_002007 [Truncatella angustata]
MRRSLEKNDDIESVKQHDFQSQNENPPKVFNSKSIAFEESMSTAEVSADSKPQTSINGPEAPPVEPSIGNKGMESGNAFSWLRSITWIPERCRYDPENPPQFSLPMNMLLGLAGTFTVANLYYPQPWLGLCLTNNFSVFIALSFICGVGYPAKDPDLSYFQLLWDIITMVVKEPLLLQACLIGFLLSAAFTSFWTTLTFLLASPPYSYSSLEIGFFAFIGIAVITLGPLWSRLITDRFMPLFSVILGLCFEIIGIVIGTFIGQWTVAGPIVQAITMDTGANFAHTANRTNVYNQLPPRMRNRVNTAYMVFSFAGQLTGTAVGNRLYAQGGWIWSGSCNIAFIGFGIILCFMRGPRETKWVGWRGGWNVRKDMMLETDEPTPSPERMAEEAGSVTIEGTAQRQEIKT